MAGNDVIVLGAGIVGITAALHLQQRGRSVMLIDRRGLVEETSFGNAGIIQREGVVPYTFPRVSGWSPSTPSTCGPGQRPWSALRGSRPGSSITGGRRRLRARLRPRAARPLVERCVVRSMRR